MVSADSTALIVMLAFCAFLIAGVVWLCWASKEQQKENRK